MPHRDFTLDPVAEEDPPTFTIEGREFKCLPSPPGGTLADLFWAFQARDIPRRSAGLVQFLLGCLPDSEADAFELLIHDKTTRIPLTKLAEIANWLVETYTLRPTTPSSGSENGSLPTPATSEGGVDSSGSTSEPQDSQS